MDEKSFDDYESHVKAGGTFIINTSMIDKKCTRTDINVIEIPFTEIATELGAAKSANMVAFGAVVKTLNVISVEDAEAAIKAKMKPELVDINIKAFEAGYNFK